MPNTLKVIVQPYENSEEPQNSIEDRNIELVRRGFPASSINIGHNTPSRLDSSFARVEHVVVFNVELATLQPAQKVFLDHLIRSNVIKSYILTDVAGRKLADSEEG